jgi:hypothetical protein
MLLMVGSCSRVRKHTWTKLSRVEVGSSTVLLSSIGIISAPVYIQCTTRDHVPEVRRNVLMVTMGIDESSRSRFEVTGFGQRPLPVAASRARAQSGGV